MARPSFKILAPLAAIVSIALSLSASPVDAAEKTVSVGGVQVVVPEIDGFSDLSSTPAGAERASVFVEKNARLMAFLTEPPNNRNYFIVKTPRDLEESVLTKEEFRQFADGFRASRVKMKSVGNFANQQIKEKHSEIEQATGRKFDDARFSAPVLVAEGRNDDVSFGYTVASKLSGEVDGHKGAVVMLMCTHAVLVQGKMVIIQMHSPRLSDTDDARVGAECRQYVDRLIKANTAP